MLLNLASRIHRAPWAAALILLVMPPLAARADILVTDRLTSDILRYTTSGTPLGSFIATGGTKPTGPIGITFGPDGFLYVSSSANNQILRYDRNGVFKDVFASGGNLHGPADIEVGPDGNLYVANFDNFSGTSIEVFDPWASTPAQRYVGTFASASATVPLNGPTFIEFNKNGNLFVSATAEDQVLEFSAAGSYLGVYAAGSNLAYPGGLAFDSSNRLLVASLLTGPILRNTGTANSPLSVYIPGTLNIDFPSDVQLDYNGDVLVAQLTGGGVYRYHEDPVTHKITTTALTQGAFQPGQFAWIPEPGDANGDRRANGVDYIAWADHYNQKVRLGPVVGDFNSDMKVDGLDYIIWADHYTSVVSAAVPLAVPEPTTAALASGGLVALMLVAIRRRMRSSRR
jgi:hypothetical protein